MALVPFRRNDVCTVERRTNDWEVFSMIGAGLLRVANILPTRLAMHRSGKPHGCPRGDSAAEPLTLDPGTQAVSGLRHQAYGVSRCREDRDSAAQPPHGGGLMASRGVFGQKLVRKPHPTLENHAQTLIHRRSNSYGA